jgi:hypothetical protein
MNVGQVQGAGGLGRGPERPLGKRHAVGGDGATSGRADAAHISGVAQETLESIRDLAEQIRRAAEDRRRLIEEARQKLLAGALDRPEVYEAVAESVLADQL